MKQKTFKTSRQRNIPQKEFSMAKFPHGDFPPTRNEEKGKRGKRRTKILHYLTTNAISFQNLTN